MSQGTDTPVNAPGPQPGEDDAAEKLSFVAARCSKRKLLAELCGESEDDQLVRPEDLLPRWPTNPATDPDVASMLFEDFRQRSRRGEEPSIAEYEQRFPEHKDSVAS